MERSRMHPERTQDLAANCVALCNETGVKTRTAVNTSLNRWFRLDW